MRANGGGSMDAYQEREKSTKCELMVLVVHMALLTSAHDIWLLID